jgi:type III restriction enzyme
MVKISAGILSHAILSEKCGIQAELRGGGLKTLFTTTETRGTIPDESKEFYDEVTEEGRGYQWINTSNKYDFKTPLNAVIADHDPEKRFVKQLIDPGNAGAMEGWIKSTPNNFYPIDYSWKKGEHPKRGVFNPDFFIKSKDMIHVVEIKSDDEIREPSPENPKKYEYAIAHFNRINEHLKKNKHSLRYKFNFLTPLDYNKFFRCLREGTAADFHSQLDVKLGEGES